MKREVNGILILDKGKGYSSNSALQKVKYLYNAKKAGHTGSLDPLATGVLPICFGKYTKMSDKFLSADKKYTTTIKLGEYTTTGDAEGEVVEHKEVLWNNEFNQETIESVVNSFKGEQEQVPSMYSALKHNGVPLYKLARQGIEVPRKSRIINIYDIELLNLDKINNTIIISVHCSKGTYIRSLAEDLGKKLGVGAYVLELRRTAVSEYDLSKAVTEEQLEFILSSNNKEYSYIDQLLIL